ncbi:MAG: hypothetical protein RJA70_936 [Pseudomonadota bacterium]
MAPGATPLCVEGCSITLAARTVDGIQDLHPQDSARAGLKTRKGRPVGPPFLCCCLGAPKRCGDLQGYGFVTRTSSMVMLPVSAAAVAAFIYAPILIVCVPAASDALVKVRVTSTWAPPPSIRRT